MHTRLNDRVSGRHSDVGDSQTRAQDSMSFQWETGVVGNKHKITLEQLGEGRGEGTRWEPGPINTPQDRRQG